MDVRLYFIGEFLYNVTSNERIKMATVYEFKIR